MACGRQKSFAHGNRSRPPQLPPSPREWISRVHQVYVLLVQVDDLELSEILIPAQAKDLLGDKGLTRG